MIPLVPPVAPVPPTTGLPRIVPPGMVMLNTQEPVVHPPAFPLACTLTKIRSTPLASWNDVTGEHTAVELAPEPESVTKVVTAVVPPPLIPAGLERRYTTPFTQPYRFPAPPLRYVLSKASWVPIVVLGLFAPPFARLKAVPVPGPGEALLKLEVTNRLIKLLCDASQPYPIKA